MEAHLFVSESTLNKPNQVSSFAQETGERGKQQLDELIPTTVQEKSPFLSSLALWQTPRFPSTCGRAPGFSLLVYACLPPPSTLPRQPIPTNKPKVNRLSVTCSPHW
jgi:hypothetical protein